MRKFVTPPAMLEISWRNAQVLSQWNDLWLVKVCRHGLDFFKAWKQSHEEVQKSSYLSEHLNYNMLKGYYGIFAQWRQKYILPTATLIDLIDRKINQSTAILIICKNAKKQLAPAS